AHAHAGERGRGQRSGLGDAAAAVFHVQGVGRIPHDGQRPLDGVDVAVVGGGGVVGRGRLGAAHVHGVHVGAAAGVGRGGAAGPQDIDGVGAGAAGQEGGRGHGRAVDEEGVAAGTEVDAQVGQPAVGDAPLAHVQTGQSGGGQGPGLGNGAASVV